jgi:hypothetical protein
LTGAYDAYDESRFLYIGAASETMPVAW